tara:strand:- start:28 stop:777 length:750 start_codon:yes stop_codon:yes gene_type:complete
MHSSSVLNLERFFKIYLKKFNNPTILDYGGASHDNKTTALTVLEKHYTNYKYLSLDIAANEENKYELTRKNVDIVVKDPYKINELEKESIDIIVCTSVFEHIEFFWLAYLEILKLLKPKGIFYLNAPSNGNFHRWPTDCWRFYPDSGNALVKWGKYNKFKPKCLESFTTKQILECGWNDYVSIILKDEAFTNDFDNTIISEHNDYYNGIDKEGKLSNFLYRSEDQSNWGYRLWYKFRKRRDKKKYKVEY